MVELLLTIILEHIPSTFITSAFFVVCFVFKDRKNLNVRSEEYWITSTTEGKVLKCPSKKTLKFCNKIKNKYIYAPNLRSTNTKSVSILMRHSYPDYC